MKLSAADNRKLSEIYRRLSYFHKWKLDTKLLYLALPSEAKSLRQRGLIKCYGKETPKVDNWYHLTEKGKNSLKSLQMIQKYPQKKTP